MLLSAPRIPKPDRLALIEGRIASRAEGRDRSTTKQSNWTARLLIQGVTCEIESRLFIEAKRLQQKGFGGSCPIHTQPSAAVDSWRRCPSAEDTHLPESCPLKRMLPSGISTFLFCASSTVTYPASSPVAYSVISWSASLPRRGWPPPRSRSESCPPLSPFKT